MNQERERKRRVRIEEYAEILEAAAIDVELELTDEEIPESLLHEKGSGNMFPKTASSSESDTEGTEAESLHKKWIIICAEQLDGHTAFLKQEKAFEAGFDQCLKRIKAYEESIDDDDMVEKLEDLQMILRLSKGKLQRVFRRHIDETQEIVCRPPLLKRRSSRPMSLSYRPVRELKTMKVTALEAVPAFYYRKERIEYEEILTELKKQKVIPDIWNYFLYEASDMAERLRAYGHQDILMELPLLAGVATQAKTVARIHKWMQESEAKAEAYAFIIEERDLEKPGKTFLANLEKIQKDGFRIILKDYTATKVTQETLEPLGIREVVLDASMQDHLDEEKKTQIKALIEAGYQIGAEGIVDDSYQEELLKLGVFRITGALAGEEQDEEEILKTLG